VYGFVVMREHVHLLVDEPDHDTLAAALSSSLNFPKASASPKTAPPSP
jgi:hypothetical protein